MKSQPLITVRDVPASSRFYQQLLGAQSGHGGDEYEQIVLDGHLLLQLHHHDAHEHPHLCDEAIPVGNGVLLCFETEAFEAVVERARSAQVHLLEEPHWNELAGHRECLVRDPDGYKVMLNSPFDPNA